MEAENACSDQGLDVAKDPDASGKSGPVGSGAGNNCQPEPDPDDDLPPF
jgi:hypothetical protein